MNTVRIDGPGLDNYRPHEKEATTLLRMLEQVRRYGVEWSKHQQDEPPAVPFEGAATLDCLVDHGDGPCTCPGFDGNPP